MNVGTTVRTPAGNAEISVLAGGVPQPLYQHPAGGRRFVAGAPGRIYTLRVRNLTSNRIEVISTVDGRNTLKDEPGDSHANRGLVFAAHSTGEFTGWRIDNEQTREFIFRSPSASVAAQATGSEANTGVIGFAVYREWSSYDSYVTRSTPVVTASASFGEGAATMDCLTINDASGGMQTRSLGTGIGEARSDHVSATTFTRGHAEPDVLAIGYETEDILRMRGLIGPAEPDAFPGVPTGYEKYAAR